MIDVSGAIAAFAETVTITRTAAGTTGATGIVTAGATSTLEIQASVQPLNGRDLQMLEGGLLNDGSVKLYTTTELVPYVPEGPKADVLSWNSRTYEIHATAEWTPGGYYKYIGNLKV